MKTILIPLPYKLKKIITKSQNLQCAVSNHPSNALISSYLVNYFPEHILNAELILASVALLVEEFNE